MAATISLKWDGIETVGHFCLLDEQRGTLVALVVGILERTAWVVADHKLVLGSMMAGV